MKSRMLRTSSALWTLVGLCFVVGCGPSDDPRLEQLKKQFLKQAPPEAADSIRQVLDMHAAGTGDLSAVTIVGRIHGGDLDPIDPKQASFALSELPEPGHNHDDPGDCPFCKHKAESAPVAVVQFEDEDGKIVDISTSELFGLTKNSDVVVSGSCTLVDEMLVLSAQSLTILPDVDSARKLLQGKYSVSSDVAGDSDAASDEYMVQLDSLPDAPPVSADDQPPTTPEAE
ncbi:MAG: hypothetical protein Aurels2KO_04730 [Aureliella sp.]